MTTKLNIITLLVCLVTVVVALNHKKDENDRLESKLKEIKGMIENVISEDKKINSLKKEWIDLYIEERKKEIEEKNKNSTIREVSAYNVGDVYQCDDTPCISANNEDICLALELNKKRCAANFVPLGTTLVIDNYGECLVTDRMNSRFKNRVDIAMKYNEKERALKFGVQKLKVAIKE